MKYLKSFRFWVLVLSLTYTAFGFILIPWFLTNKLSPILKDKIGLHVELGETKFNPYTFRLTLNDILLKDLNNKPALSIKQIFVDYSPIALLNSTVLFKNIKIDSPKLYTALNKNGKLNLENILPPSPKNTKEEKKSEPSSIIFTLYKFSITNGSLNFKDLRKANPFSVDFGPINFMAHDISTKPDDLNAYSFYTKINNHGELFWEGGMRLNPLKIYGEVTAKNISLPKLYKYTISDFEAILSNGEINLNIPYQIDLSKEVDVSINGASLSLNNILFINKTTNHSVVDVQNIAVDGIYFDLLKKSIDIEKATISKPNLFTLLNENGDLTITNAFTSKIKKQKTKPNQETEDKWNFHLKDTTIDNGIVTFIDNMTNKQIPYNLSNLSINIKDISLDKNIPITYSLDTKLNKKSHINTLGSVITEPFNLKSTVSVSNLNSNDFIEYIKPFINFKLDSANISAKAKVDVSYKDALKLDLISDIDISNLLINTNNGDKLLLWKNLGIDNLHYVHNPMKLSIEKLKLDDSYLRAYVYKDGTTNFDGLVKPNSKNTSKEKSSSFNFYLKDAIIDNAHIVLDDSLSKTKIQTELSKLSLHVKDISQEKNKPITYKLSTKLNKTSQLNSNGSITTKPFKLSSSFDLKKFDATHYLAYLKPYVNFELKSATIDTKTDIQLSYQNSLKLNTSSDIDINRLLINTNDGEKLLQWKKLDIKALHYVHDPMELTIKRLNLDEPFVKAHIDEKGKTNFAGLIKDSNSTAKNDNNSSIKIKIGPMKLVNGTSDFSDFSLPFPFKTHIHSLNGDFSTLDFQSTIPANLKLTGKIDKYGYADIEGRLLPLDLTKDSSLNILFKNIDLTSLTPYSSKFVGYKIKKGKLSMDLKYKLENERLVGDNKMNIDTLTLGEIVDSPDATSLPLEFAIALLKDENGQIDINMPVKGDINDPDFSYGGVVWRALGNMITGIVAAPFRILGEMMGIDGDKLKAIDFDKGSYKIISTEHEKLENLAKILSKRPSIKLSISGGYDSKIDKYELQKQRFKTLINKELRVVKKGANQSDVYGSVLKSLYIKTFSKQQYNELKKEFTTQIVQKDDDNKTKKISKPKLDVVAFNNEVQKSITVHIDVKKEDLEKLASKRAEAIKSELVKKYKVESTKIEISPPATQEAKRDRWIESALEVKI